MKSILESFDILAAKKVLSSLRSATITQQDISYSKSSASLGYYNWVQLWISELIPFLESQSRNVIFSWALDILELLTPSCNNLAQLSFYLLFANSIEVLGSHLFQEMNNQQLNCDSIISMIKLAHNLKQRGFGLAEQKVGFCLKKIENFEMLSQGNRVVVINEELQNIELALMKIKETLSTIASFKEFCTNYGLTIDQIYKFMLEKLFEIEAVNKLDIRGIVDIMEKAKAFYGTFTFGEKRYEERRIQLAANQIQYRMKYIPTFSRFSQALKFLSCDNLVTLQALLKREDRLFLSREEIKFLIEVVFEETIKRDQIIEQLMKSSLKI